MLNHLIIYANPNPQSFSAAIKDRIQHDLHELGHRTVVRDLYAMNFQPVLSARDFENFFRGEIPDDVRREQSHLAEADVVHLVYPLWWTGFPAILKGYFDRVFAPGFAYQRHSEGVDRLLEGKQALLWTPHGNSQAEYDQLDMYRALRKTMDEGVLDYVGIAVKAHTYFPDIRVASHGDRLQALSSVDSTLRSCLMGAVPCPDVE